MISNKVILPLTTKFYELKYQMEKVLDRFFMKLTFQWQFPINKFCISRSKKNITSLWQAYSKAKWQNYLKNITIMITTSRLPSRKLTHCFNTVKSNELPPTFLSPPEKFSYFFLLEIPHRLHVNHVFFKKKKVPRV